MTLFSRVSHTHNNRSVSIHTIMSLDAGQIPYKLSHASDAEDLLTVHEIENMFLNKTFNSVLFILELEYQCMKLK